MNISDFNGPRRGLFVASVQTGKRYVIQRYRVDVAALVSLEDLRRLLDGLSDETEEVNVTTARADFARLVDTTAKGKRYVIAAHYRDQTYSAALVGLGDLERLENPGLSPGRKSNETAKREERFKQALKDAGIEVTWPSAEVAGLRADPIEYDPHGEWISEQIIRERG